MHQRFAIISLLMFFLPASVQSEDSLLAMCYGPGLYGNKTASGTRLTRETIGIAHKTWPLGTPINIKVNGKAVKVKVIDRGPYVRGHAIDITEATVKSMGYASCSQFGVRRVQIEKCSK